MEVVIVVAILGALSIVVGKFNGNIFTFSRIFNSSLNAENDARKILKPMVNEIRDTMPSVQGSYPIESATATSFVFYSDTNNDGLAERVRYYLSGSTLKKGITYPVGSPYTYNTASEINTDLVANVNNGSNSLFSYYDSSYNGTTSPLSSPVVVASIRLVKIQVTIEADVNSSPTPLSVTTQVTLRNLKDNW